MAGAGFGAFPSDPDSGGVLFWSVPLVCWFREKNANRKTIVLWNPEKEEKNETPKLSHFELLATCILGVVSLKIEDPHLEAFRTQCTDLKCVQFSLFMRRCFRKIKQPIEGVCFLRGQDEEGLVV